MLEPRSLEARRWRHRLRLVISAVYAGATSALTVWLAQTLFRNAWGSLLDGR